METKLYCKAGWHVLALDGLTQQSSRRWEPAGEINSSQTVGMGPWRRKVAAGRTATKSHQSRSRGPQVLEAPHRVSIYSTSYHCPKALCLRS